MRNLTALLFFILFSSLTQAAEEADFLAFFEEYQRLSSKYDAMLNQMYAADAKIIGVRKKPDGTDELMTIDGERWKTIIVASMENVKARGDSSEYSDIEVKVEGSRATIAATRYSSGTCFSDTRFYMIVEEQADKQMKIVEQFMETPLKSNCAKSDIDLPAFLQSTVEMINSQLPADVDPETRLVKTSAEGTKLTYYYVLINHTLESLSTKAATAKLQPLAVIQSCGSPNLRPILDRDGTLSYIYSGSDEVQIAKLDIDRSACTD